MENIKTYIAREELFTTRISNVGTFVYGKNKYDIVNILTLYQGTEHFFTWRGFNFYQGSGHYIADIKCYFTGKYASVMATINPNCAKAIADICGLAVSELPDVLQNFNTVPPYSGNSILSTLDPMDNIKDPFSKRFNPKISIYMGKRYLNKLRKELDKS